MLADPKPQALGSAECARMIVSQALGSAECARMIVSQALGSAECARTFSRTFYGSGVRFSGLLAPLLVLALLPACGRDSPTEEREQAGDEVVLTPEAAKEGRAAAKKEGRDPRSKARAVELRGAGAEQPKGDPSDDAPSPGAASDAEVRAELREARAALRSFKAYLSTTAYLQTGPRAKVLPDGTAVAPDDAPEVVKRVILAGNQISKFPYKWGGGHGAWRDTGYDCSGSVSFALAGAGLLEAPRTSGGFIDWGAPGDGEWITIYANYGHIFMVVAGLRFDTSGRGRAGTRWQEAPASTRGFAVRHLPGL
jgi:cell wall-associated NlpC family hydrolase